jgi:hypothetical protein
MEGIHWARADSTDAVYRAYSETNRGAAQVDPQDLVGGMFS